jgi:hypothetical protein
MNERIQQLMNKSFTDHQGEQFDIERFAELIVKECTDVLLKWKGEPFPFDEDLAVRLIREHFGL